MWARMKRELLYDRYDTESMTIVELKVLSGGISSVIGTAGEYVLPMVEWQRYYESLMQAVWASTSLI